MVIQDLRADLSTINTKYDEFVTRCLIYRSVYDLCHVYRMRPDLFKGNKGPFKFAPLLTCGLTAMLVVHSCQPVSAWHGCEFPSKPENFFPLMIESCSLHVKMMLWFVSFPSAKRQCGLMLVRRHWFFCAELQEVNFYIRSILLMALSLDASKGTQNRSHKTARQIDVKRRNCL